MSTISSRRASLADPNLLRRVPMGTRKTLQVNRPLGETSSGTPWPLIVVAALVVGAAWLASASDR